MRTKQTRRLFSSEFKLKVVLDEVLASQYGSHRTRILEISKTA
jgi:hypothetical protein